MALAANRTFHYTFARIYPAETSQTATFPTQSKSILSPHAPFAQSPALLMAHPGHELRIYGWLESAKPITCVLTDGSGHAGKSRLDRTATILKNVGASIGPVWGRFADRQIYDAVLRVDCALFLDISNELAEFLVQQQTKIVVADAAEGIILSHDLWRGMVNRAMRIAQQRLETKLQNWAFLLDGPFSQVPPEANGAVHKLALDAPAWNRKLQTANSYEELRHEVQMAIAHYGEDSLKTEILFEASLDLPRDQWAKSPPTYERHGEKQVAAGIYQDVVRYRTHVAPILDALESS